MGGDYLMGGLEVPPIPPYARNRPGCAGAVLEMHVSRQTSNGRIR